MGLVAVRHDLARGCAWVVVDRSKKLREEVPSERNLEERNLEKVPSDGNPMIRRLAMCVAVAKVLAMSGVVLVSALLLAFALSGCGHIGNARAFPLYPNPDKPRPTASLAHLQGPIGWVDAIDVEPYGTVFDVLPGCHVVTLRRKVGASDVSGAWVADLGTITYVFWMKPDHLYSVDVSVRFRGASHGTMTITAEDRDSAGTAATVVPQARGMREIEACQDWQAAATLPSPERAAPTPTPTMPMKP